MNLSEAEIQVLASVQAAELNAAPTDRATLEEGGERFSEYLEDWSGAFSSLVAKDLIESGDSGYRLTESGRPLGHAYHQERPDRFWYYYQRFRKAAYESATHSRCGDHGMTIHPEPWRPVIPNLARRFRSFI